MKCRRKKGGEREKRGLSRVGRIVAAAYCLIFKPRLPSSVALF